MSKASFSSKMKHQSMTVHPDIVATPPLEIPAAGNQPYPAMKSPQNQISSVSFDGLPAPKSGSQMVKSAS